MKQHAVQGPFRLVAHRGDAKTLLAFDLGDTARAGLAGFSIRVTPPGAEPYYLLNSLRYAKPSDHARMPGESDWSTANAPIHKFRWVHVPGQNHQGLDPVWGDYLYEVTPRYFDDSGHMLQLDPARTAAVTIEVAPFRDGSVSVGFTRGFTQSQAFTRHFGKDARIRPKGDELLFDTSEICGTNDHGDQFTYEQQYRWSGFTARALIFGLLDEAIGDPQTSVDVFAYDLNEPDFMKRLLKLGGEGRIRIILDSADLHHDPTDLTKEDRFAQEFENVAGAPALKRGKFGRYSHDKIVILKRSGEAVKVLTGSTNFAVTGFYVNSNHVLLFDDPSVAKLYADMFQEAWDVNVGAGAFRKSDFSKNDFTFGGGGLPKMTISFSPHDEPRAREVLKRITDAVDAQQDHADGLGNVMFAVMELGSTTENPVYESLNAIHADPSVFSFGISDNPDGIAFYNVGSLEGVLVTGKPKDPILPPPFDQVRGVGGGHQVHHKFVVCDVNGAGLVFCGSSNLALGGEKVNGDNLLMIEDRDIATVFAIEALALIDHFNFLGNVAKPKAPAPTPGAAPAAPAPAPPAAPPPPPPANLAAAADSKGWHLGTDDSWAAKYFDAGDLHSKDRQIFATP
jgi:phosphatidylserine/phosphatidylglycerophosphate/cardiolipin synthase-like enzyme